MFILYGVRGVDFCGNTETDMLGCVPNKTIKIEKTEGFFVFKDKFYSSLFYKEIKEINPSEILHVVRRNQKWVESKDD